MSADATHRKKAPVLDPTDDWGPWTAARFADPASRDRFLTVVAARDGSEVAAEPMPGEDRSARVRWRPGHFLVLNDTAYAHGGRILAAVPRHWV